MRRILYFFLPIALAMGSSALAVERAPRISDREIVERLTRLEEGQRSMQQRTEQRFSTVEQRLSSMEKRMDERFEAMNKKMDERFSAMNKKMDERFSAMQKQLDDRFSAMQKQLDDRFSFMQKQMDLMRRQMENHMMIQWNLILALIVAILGLVGFVVWDRATALKPLERRFTRIADEIEKDLGMDSPEDSKLTRLVNALRALAPEDGKLSDALKRFSLLEDAPRKA
uniref:Uncharacterized protein n=1 Tax=Candidatus Kentrum sp. TC TaxID=2126339 RepID=A0A451A9B3_9GAMM|nr:MAG: hypothetical protein BECKTC1821E_GA0114239_10815 [Candidatus Kentron sp. TC]VFK62622.1 MAG: hypothetical protein BECKTC1821F_GA0114240_10776 [Candidatus Kentron sp. TC]